MGKVRAHEIRSSTKSALKQKVEELKKDLSNLRVQQKSGSKSTRVAKIGGLRKDIARVLTVMNQDTKKQLRAYHATEGGRIPLDMRAKSTRAMRRKLTTEEASKKTVKQTKKDSNFPQRKYAVSAN
tara:strand:+ start:52 stop:429 length:378 start_codon:yes stop_codon:yes gene_type:complete